MHEGWEYVVAAYGTTAVTLGAWFFVILRKHARQKRALATQERADG